MSNIEEVTQSVRDLTETLALTDSKLDEIKIFIDELKANTGEQLVTQEQLDTLSDLVDAAKTAAAERLTETDDLDKTETDAPIE